MIVGSKCIVNYKEEMARMGHQTLPIIFRSAGAAKYMNAKHPGIAVVGPIWLPSHDSYNDPDVDEFYEDEEEDAEREWLMAIGLDPNNPDFSDLAPHGMSGDEDEDND